MNEPKDNPQQQLHEKLVRIESARTDAKAPAEVRQLDQAEREAIAEFSRAHEAAVRAAPRGPLIVNLPTFPITPPLPAGLTQDGLPTPELLAQMCEQDGRLFSEALRSRERLLGIPHYAEFSMWGWLRYQGSSAGVEPEPGTYVPAEFSGDAREGCIVDKSKGPVAGTNMLSQAEIERLRASKREAIARLTEIFAKTKAK